MEQDGYIVENFPELKKAFGKHTAEVRRVCDEALSKGAMSIISEAQHNLRMNGTNSTGLLSNSGRAEKLGSCDYQAGFFSEEQGKGYAEYVENGRKEGKMPPPKILTAWVWKKLRILKEKQAASVQKKLRIRNEKQAASVAFVIARKIAKNGTKAQPFFGPAVASQQKVIYNEIKTALMKIINRGK